MNSWELRETAIVESDDFQDKYDRNGLNYLFYWKAKYPKFKITLFTIPGKTSKELLELISSFKRYNMETWVELAVHGWDHDSNFECYSWDYDKTKTLMNRLDNNYIKMFKAPGWTIYPGLNGYPSAPEDPITKDPLGVYNAMKDMDFIVVDRHYNNTVRPKGLKHICIDCNPDIVHMHTWNMMTPDENGRNGFEQVETRGVPWDKDTKFYTMMEAWDKGMIKECTGG